MANEGSTKPTYSELERELAHQKANVAEMYRDCMKAEERVRELESLPTEWEGSGYSPQQMGRLVLQYRERQAEIRTLSTSLARVRGLLQRLGNAWEMDPHGDAFLDIMGELGAFDDVPPTFPQSSSVVSQGAESVDIGKLDAADKSANWGISGNINVLPKSGVEMRKVNSAPHSSMAEPFPYKGQVAGSSPVAATILNELVSAIVTYLVEMSADNLDVLDKAVDKSQAWLMAGSAETGGEKADLAGTTQAGKLMELMAHPVSSPSVRERLAALPADETVFFRHAAPSFKEEMIHLIETIITAQTEGMVQVPLARLKELEWLVEETHTENDGCVICDGTRKKGHVSDCWIGIAVASANFPRSSQNQAVSSGVEGAHEGTTADKSKSREPEKPISLQPISDETRKFVALAESSLSYCPHFTDGRKKSDCGICGVSSLSSPPPENMSVPKRFVQKVRSLATMHDIRAMADEANELLEGAASPELLPTQLPKEK